MDSFKIDFDFQVRLIIGAVDFCISIEYRRRYDIDPQTCRTTWKDKWIMDGTKECVYRSGYRLQLVACRKCEQTKTPTRYEHGVFACARLMPWEAYHLEFLHCGGCSCSLL